MKEWGKASPPPCLPPRLALQGKKISNSFPEKFNTLWSDLSLSQPFASHAGHQKGLLFHPAAEHPAAARSLPLPPRDRGGGRIGGGGGVRVGGR